MDNNRNDIGRAIRNKLEGMQQQPQAGGWDKLRAELDSGKKKRGIQNWLWPLALLFITLSIGLACFLWTNSIAHTGTKPVNAPAETTVNDINSTGTETNKLGSEMNSGNVNAGTENQDTHTNDADNEQSSGNVTNTNASKSNATGAKSNKMVTDADAVGTKAGKAVANTGYNDTNTNSDIERTRHNNAHNKSTYTSTANGDAAPGRVSVPKNKDQGGSIATAGGVINTLAYGPDKNGVITTGADTAKERIAGISKSQKTKGGITGNTSRSNAETKTLAASVAGNYYAKKPLAEPKKAALNTGYSKSANGTIITAASNLISNSGNVSDSISVSNDSLSTAETNMLIARTATGIFAGTLTENDSTTIPMVADSLAHELAEKIKDSLPADVQDTDKNSDAHYKRFYAFAYAAPELFLNNSGRAAIDSRLNGLKTETKMAFSYGALLGIEATRHWGIRAGVLLSRLERTTNGVVIDSLGEQNYSGINYTPGFNNNMFGELFKGLPVSIIQKTELFELPVEITYRVSGNKWSGKFMGGFSAVWVRSNSVCVQRGSYTIIPGSAHNTRQTSFTAGLGAGLYYEILPNLQLNIEPFVKYYINTFNNSSPFSMSIRAGVQYNFDLSKKKK